MPTNVPRAFEALARRAIYEAQWREGLKHCENWKRDQPFSVDPYIQEGFCACEAEDWVRAMSTCEKGLNFHRNNRYLLNNLAFAQIGSGHLREAYETLLTARRLEGGADARLALTATEAMWLFRIGEAEEGRKRYNTVIRLFAKTHRLDDAARAALMLAQEEKHSGSDFAEESWSRATDLVGQSSKGPQLIRLQERIEKPPSTNLVYQVVFETSVVLQSAVIDMLKPPELD
jgi:tetratricopeptide (TPR) repeat protein